MLCCVPTERYKRVRDDGFFVTRCEKSFINRNLTRNIMSNVFELSLFFFFSNFRFHTGEFTESGASVSYKPNSRVFFFPHPRRPELNKFLRNSYSLERHARIIILIFFISLSHLFRTAISNFARAQRVINFYTRTRCNNISG